MVYGEVQTKILLKILQSDGLRYSEAYPGEEIDDDLYNYHLKQLIKNGVIEKNEGKYVLTSLGRSEVQMMDVLGEYQEQFRVSVLMYVTLGDKILMCRRTRWPLRGDVTSPAGKVRRGEKMVEAAKRKLKAETNLEAEFKLIGVLRSARKFENKIVEDTIYNICVAHEPKGELSIANEHGEFFWTGFDEAIKFASNNVAGGENQIEILNRVKNNKTELFYLEEVIELSRY